MRDVTPYLPAVVVPSFLKTGFSLPKSPTVVDARIPSSTDIVTGVSSPDFGSTILLKKGSEQEETHIKYENLTDTEGKR